MWTDHRKFSYERHEYESVDDRLYLIISVGTENRTEESTVVMHAAYLTFYCVTLYVNEKFILK